MTGAHVLPSGFQLAVRWLSSPSVVSDNPKKTKTLRWLLRDYFLQLLSERSGSHGNRSEVLEASRRHRRKISSQSQEEEEEPSFISLNFHRRRLLFLLFPLSNAADGRSAAADIPRLISSAAWRRGGTEMN
ncbi:hypothetical protein EYF80_041700 [Liparis tanakae]|uniref:Uncharacterized protein n=1 Tax=Liparis tanakae TaxID=230148 RepID=A0A4Z2G4R6_9TELE|nr:hypothetical protein EYF80_041700 [Liparis tanakae]